MKVDENAYYTKTHEWVRQEGEEAVSGVTDHAQESLSDIVYVELPEVGEQYEKGEAYGLVESVKAASDIYMPMGGTITAVNEALYDAPEKINESPYGEGWLIKFSPDDAEQWDDLLTVDAYRELEEGES